MRAALENYSSYLNGSDRRALGRFIVPFPRLHELEEVGADLMARGKRALAWQLSVLVAEDVRTAGEEMLRFNRSHSATNRGLALIDAVEMKASTAEEIRHQKRDLPNELTAYFEIPLTGDMVPLVKTIASVGARAKMRTGGVTPQAFPPAQAVIDFIAACWREHVAFKATAGLHHPLRASHRLTYERDSPKGLMYGFLNVFLAAALVYAGESEETALSALEETNPAAFDFEDGAIRWRDKVVTADQIAGSRTEFAIAFGSCSFREPVDELAHLTQKVRAADK